jgi:membrane dipeptidase
VPATRDVTDLYRRSVVIDAMNNAGLTGDYLRTVRDAGVTVAMVPASITDTFNAAIERILALREVVSANSDVVSVVQCVDDIKAAKAAGRLGLVLALEDSRQLEKDLRKVQLFHDLGVRRMQLVYTTVNDAGSGPADRVDVGLSRFGEQLVQEIQSRGVLLDLCHAGPATLRDAVAVATKPAIWSHTNTRAVFDHPNNMSDAELDLVAANGGVVGVSGVPFYACGPDGSIERVLDHVDHVVQRIGIDHVGIGLAIFENHPLSFYERFASLPREIYGDPPWSWPPGISTIGEFPNIAERLAARGYDDGQLEAILGGNVLRLLETAWTTTSDPRTR